MALLFGRARRDLSGYYGSALDFGGATATDLIPARVSIVGPNLPAVTTDTAMQHSGVWAALRLRANLLSTLPLDVFRKVDGIQVELAKPPVLKNPSGDRVTMQEWLYSTQIDLDRTGNAFGVITERNGTGLPNRIDLVCASDVTVRIRSGKLSYQIGSTTYEPEQVWHEKQYTLSGLPVGLSPIAYAAYTLAKHRSINDFALTWFSGGGVPRGHLRNKMQTLSPATSDAVKARFKSTVSAGDVFVTGADWEYSMIQAEQTGMEWLEAEARTGLDIARFFDVPSDMIDAAVAGQAITYANITQRNVQFLVMHLGPTINRREESLSRLTPGPRFVKLNTDALLRMDPSSRADMHRVMIESRVLTPDEARELENRRPLTLAQLQQFIDLFGDPNTAEAGSFGPASTPAPAQPGQPKKPAPTPGGTK